MTQTLPNWKKKLPTQLTLSRAYVVPLIIYFLTRPEFYFSNLAAILFVAASITDYYDGHLARKWGLVSNFGKFMDPVTDKILVSSVLVYLCYRGFIDPYVVILLTARDTFIGGIRSIASSDQVVIDAKSSGKWKTGLQMGAIPALILGKFYNNQYEIDNLVPFFSKVGQLAYTLLWLSCILSLVSGWQYYKIYMTHKSK